MDEDAEADAEGDVDRKCCAKMSETEEGLARGREVWTYRRRTDMVAAGATVAAAEAVLGVMRGAVVLLARGARARCGRKRRSRVIRVGQSIKRRENPDQPVNILLPLDSVSWHSTSSL
jgi:hypothetical protein